MKKFKLLSVNEWTSEDISNPLDENIYNILTKDLTLPEKIEAYKELVLKYVSPHSDYCENIAEKENPQTFSKISVEENSIPHKNETELEGAGYINQSNATNDFSEKSEKISNSYSVLPISNPPGIQITNWRKLWLDL